MHPKLSKKILLGVTILVVAMHTLIAKEPLPLEAFTIRELETQISEIDLQLEQLAQETLRSGVGNLGWLSRDRDNATYKEWVEIRLRKDTPIDLIVLAPVIWLDAKTGPRADAFPEEFKVLVGKNGNEEGTIVASFDASDNLLPRVAPVVIPITPTTADWVRIEATKLSKSAWNDKYLFQLSEVMIFNGQENVALHQPVRASSSKRDNVEKSMFKQALVDGFMPYVMDAAHGDMSEPCMAYYRDGIEVSFIVDLEETQLLDGVRLHIADIRENFPKTYHADHGVPKHLIVEGANRSDFSDAVQLAEYRRESIYEAGPIIMLGFPEASCRYVRLTALEGYGAPEATGVTRCYGLAEIELLSRGKNVAVNKTTRINKNLRHVRGVPMAMTDGRNHYGDILPLRDWIEQLALRHEWETKRPLVAAELNQHYVKQERRLQLMSWLAACLGAGIIITVLFDRILRMREVAQLKQRFAADLHDELGANLHSIGLISDLAKDADSKAEWHSLSQRIRDLTERTGTAVRHCTNMLEAKSLYIGLVADMKRSAERITTNLTHNITIEGEAYLEKLKPRQRVDLFLFYKESLVNICRHSGATEVETHLSADPKNVTLTIHDNGIGLPAQVSRTAPKSLQRRAELLKAQLTVASNDREGTSICLKLRI